MTGEELAKAILEYAKGIAPDATVIVFAAMPTDVDDGESLATMNVSPYDLTTVMHMVTDAMLEDMEAILDKIEAPKAPAPVERPS